MSGLSEQLSPEELQAYEQCKAQIKGGFLAIAHALTQIRDRRLYRAEFGSFEEFCRIEMKRADRSWADRQITALGTVQVLESAEVEILPNSAAQVRALNQCAPEQKIEIWNLACSLAGGIPSSRLVERAERHARTLPRGSAAYSAGQAISVKDQKSPHFEKVGVIERINGLVLYTNINGQTVALLPSEVEELQQPSDRPRPAVQSSPLLEARLSVAEYRLQRMESLLEQILAIASPALPPDLLEQARRLIS